MKFYLCATNCSEYLGDNGRYDSNKIPEGAHIEWYKDDRGYHDEMYVDLHTIDELLSFVEKGWRRNNRKASIFKVQTKNTNAGNRNIQRLSRINIGALYGVLF